MCWIFMWEKQRDNREFVGGCDYIFGHYSFRWRRLFWFLLKLLKLLKCKRVGDERIGRWKGLDDDDRMDGWCWCCDMLVAVRIKKKKKKIIVCWREKKVIMNFVSIAKGSGRPHRWLHLYCCIVYLCFFFSFFLSFSPSLSIYVYIYILFFSLTSACSSIFSFSPLPFIKEIKSKKKLTY